MPKSIRWIVVDNASVDDSREVAKSLGAHVVSLDHNIGFGAANNVGFKLAESPYIAFVNPDVTIPWDSLPVLAVAIDRSSGLVSPQLINMDGSLQPNGRGWPYLLRKVQNRLGNSSKPNAYRLYADRGEYREVVWMIGAAVLGSREAFDRLNGPWDERFFVYYEDKDLCLRARAIGLSSIVVGDVQWIHGWERATTTLNVAAWRREFASMATFYARYPALLLGIPHAKYQKFVRLEGPTSDVR